MAMAHRELSDRRESGVLALLHGFVGLGAIGGGIALMTGSSGMPNDYLHGTIFSSYVIPGLALAGLVGGTSLLAAWRMARHGDRALGFSFLASLVLAGWFVVQVLQVGLISWLQPFMMAMLGAQVVLAARMRRQMR